ncbi:4-alpha-glucanotransferase [Microbacterium fluvii]|uniref:4-alpha-glucanotransferase n=1 Tax=Microbacterium fluvii TaxID=415215 RepID=A0ABW2HG33_9MICO|nr:4-alpha-glucanotransferase [Microbacterium fluvii]MCU4673687.1 4-alpha-glucanotransferase [Microbacterium fluvii]
MAELEQPTADLVALADRHGVATEYWSFFGEQVHVPAPTLRAVLTAMGVDAETDRQVRDSLDEAELALWRDLVPASLVVKQGEGELLVHVLDGHDVNLAVDLESGDRWPLTIPAQTPEARIVDGVIVWRVRVPLPGDLPLGWHTVRGWRRAHGAASDDAIGTGALVVTPHRLAAPPTRPGNRGRGWGLMAQLYSVRSRGSWGIGDFADLADLAAIAGDRGADFLLINPVHAAEVTSPIEASPYRPSTRRFLASLYVRPEDIREVAYLSPGQRAELAEAHRLIAAENTDANRIDRDEAWAAKRRGLELVHAAPRSASRQSQLDAFVAGEGRPLRDFALWCAIEEHYAQTLPAGAERPSEAWDIGSPLVAQLRDDLAGVVYFHLWLQWIVDQQLGAAQAAARQSGMTIGVMHDLAVGVHTEGSDAWSLRDMYAPGITVGAPPDMYNQQGQNWNQPPWLPAALARAGYAPLRDMIRTLLRHAGALRIDHIIGFFRLWWIPSGLGPGAGTYVRYDHDAMIGVLALEAHRAGAVVIGEDLGLVEPWVRDYLSARGILGTSVLWFEGGGLTPPEHYRQALLATVNTHDLPPTAGYLAGDHVALREELGLLTRPAADERADAERERDAVIGMLRERGLLGESPTEQQIVEALHVHLASSPSWLLGVSLVDAVGERRVQNQPGTDKEYPNWQVPLAGPDGEAILVDDLAANERFRSLTAAVDGALRR